MRKGLLLCFTAVLLISQSAYALYDFSAVSPSGHTLYYNVVSGGASVTYLNDYVGNANLVGDLIIPATVTNSSTGTTYNVVSIGDYAFNNCFDMTSVHIPTSIKSIGGHAFYQCTGLTTIYFDADSCWQIGGSTTSAFTLCRNLSTVVFGNNVKIIPNFAFQNCNSIKIITIGTGVDSIGFSAFAECDSISIIYYNADSCYKMQPYGYFPFKNSSYPAKVIFGDNVKYIPKDLFYYYNGLRTVVIPSSVKAIGSSAFMVGINSITANLDTVIYEGSIEQWCSIDFMDKFSNPLYFANYLIINNDWIRNITISSSLHEIKGRVFNGYKSLLSVSIPYSVTQIGEFAFNECTQLQSVEIPSSVINVNMGAFRNCTSLSIAPIPDSVVYIGQNAYSNCTGFSSVTIPQTCTFIGDHAFYQCGSLGRALNSITFLSETPPVFGGIHVLGGVQASDDSYSVYIYVPCGSYWAYSAALQGHHIDGRKILEPETELHVWVVPSNYSQGYTEIITDFRGIEISCDSIVEVKATPYNGYRFDHWSKGSTAAQDTFHLMRDDTIIAFFVSTNAIEGIETNNYRVTAIDGTIIVETAGGETSDIEIYDLYGRKVTINVRGRNAYAKVLPGVYIVRVGNSHARKVVVVR